MASLRGRLAAIRLHSKVAQVGPEEDGQTGPSQAHAHPTPELQKPSSLPALRTLVELWPFCRLVTGYCTRSSGLTALCFQVLSAWNGPPINVGDVVMIPGWRNHFSLQRVAVNSY